MVDGDMSAVATIPAGVPFLESLAAGLRAGAACGDAGPAADPARLPAARRSVAAPVRGAAAAVAAHQATRRDRCRRGADRGRARPGGAPRDRALAPPTAAGAPVRARGMADRPWPTLGRGASRVARRAADRARAAGGSR